jgi:hypothetical protein
LTALLLKLNSFESLKLWKAVNNNVISACRPRWRQWPVSLATESSISGQMTRRFSLLRVLSCWLLVFRSYREFWLMEPILSFYWKFAGSVENFVPFLTAFYSGPGVLLIRLISRY